MKRRTLILIGLVFIASFSLTIGNMSISVAENKIPGQTSIPSTTSPPSESSTSTTIDESNNPTTSYDATTVTQTIGDFDSSFSIIIILLLLLISPVFAAIFLFLGFNMPINGGIASGFEGLSLIPVIFIVGIYFILKRRKEE